MIRQGEIYLVEFGKKFTIVLWKSKINSDVIRCYK